MCSNARGGSTSPVAQLTRLSPTNNDIEEMIYVWKIFSNIEQSQIATVNIDGKKLEIVMRAVFDSIKQCPQHL